MAAAATPLLDAYGREIRPELLKIEQAAPTLAGVRNIFSSSYPADSLTPEKLTGILRSAEMGDPYLYLEMCEQIEERDLRYLGLLNKRKGTTASLELVVMPASDSPFDVNVADFVREVVLDESQINLSEHLFDILDAIGKGFSVTEIIWNTERRLRGTAGYWWVPTGLEWRDPRWFMFDWISGRHVLVRSLKAQQLLEQGGTNPMFDYEMALARPAGTHHLGGNWNWNSFAAQIGIQPLTAPLIPFKFITHFGKAKSGLPIKAGLTRCIAWCYCFKTIAIKDWATFVERYGMPIRLGKYPTGATEADKAALLSAVAGIGADMAGIIPNTTSIDFPFDGASGGRARQSIHNSYLDYWNDQLAVLILGSTLGSEVRAGAGSKAAAEVHRGVEMSIVYSDAKRLEATLNRDLVKPLVDLNFGEPRDGKYPRLRIGIPDDEDSGQFVDNVVKLAGSGMKIGEKAVREKLHLPEVEEGEETLTPPQKMTERSEAQPGQGPLEAGQDRPGQRQLPPPEQKPPQPQAVLHARVGGTAAMAEDFAMRLVEKHWREVLEPLVDPVLKEVRAATSYEDLRRRLKKTARKMNPTKLEDVTRKALFMARTVGKLQK